MQILHLSLAALLFSTSMSYGFEQGSLGEPFSSKGYTQGCGVIEGAGQACSVVSLGTIFIAYDGGETSSEVMAMLRALPQSSAVTIEGDILSFGDITAEVAFSNVIRIADDLEEETIQALSGIWTITDLLGQRVQIDGSIWTDFDGQEKVDSYVVSYGPACADGVEPGGVAMVLTKMGGDPGLAGECYQVEYIGNDVLTLREIPEYIRIEMVKE
jgi:hypothetical protein